MWAELSGLTRASAALWWRFLPRLLLWFWLGYAVHALCVQSAAAFGADAKVTGNIFFGVALIATGGGTLLMLHALGPGLTEFRRRLARFRRTPPSSPGETGPVPAIPTDVAAWRGGLDTVAVTIGPFLAIYSVWGMVGDEVLGLFVTNAKNYGTGSVDKWSIDLTDTRFYVLTAAAVWAVRLVVLAAARLVRRRATTEGPVPGSPSRGSCWRDCGSSLPSSWWGSSPATCVSGSPAGSSRSGCSRSGCG